MDCHICGTSMFLCRKTPDKECHLSCLIMHWTTRLKHISIGSGVPEVAGCRIRDICQRMDDSLGVSNETLRERGWVEHIRRK